MHELTIRVRNSSLKIELAVVYPDLLRVVSAFESWKWLRHASSYMFHSFCHAGLMQHVAGKDAFNSSCTNTHTQTYTNSIGKNPERIKKEKQQNIDHFWNYFQATSLQPPLWVADIYLVDIPITEQIKATPASFVFPAFLSSRSVDCLQNDLCDFVY